MLRICKTGLLIAICVFGVQPFCQAQDPVDQTTRPVGNVESQETPDVHKLRPQFATEELLTRAEKSIQDGFDFLVANQNEDGSWGSLDPRMAALGDFGFQIRNRGSQDGVRAACTAICAEAILSQKNRTPEQQAALDKAILELVKVRKFAYHPGESFNTWGYGYKLGFLVLLADAPEGKDIQDEIHTAAQSCVDGLLKFQQHAGGWGYYAGVMRNGSSMSFNTAIFALSLARASDMGVNVPDGMVSDATAAVDRQRTPDGVVAYDSRFESEAGNPGCALAPLGAGARTAAVTMAMFEIGMYSQEDLGRAMKIFDTGENYLEEGRKLIQPHTATHQVSGYFFFFGYNYVTQVAELLGHGVTQDRWDRFCWTMLRTQEEDGCWWDTPAGNYGDKWGTGFAIQTLQRYVRETRHRLEDASQNE